MNTNIGAYLDRCGLRLLILVACFAFVNAFTDDAPLRVFAAVAATLAAAGALDRVLPQPEACARIRTPSLRGFAEAAFRRSNAKRFITAALLLAAAAFFLPFRIPYIAAAGVLAVLAAVCLSRRN